MGSIEKIMVAGILVIICVILGIAIWGAQSLDDPTAQQPPRQEKAGQPDKPPIAKAAASETGAVHERPDLKAVETEHKPAPEKPAANETPPAAKPLTGDDPLATPATAQQGEPRPATTPQGGADKKVEEPKPAVADERKSAETTAKPEHHTVWQYTVKKGDTYSSIAKQFYGKANLAADLARMNEDTDERGLRPGQILNMPPTQRSDAKAEAPWYLRKDQPKAEPAKSDVTVQKGARTYVVRDGDTLTSIARAVLGRPDWNTLYELNRSRIADPKALKPGQEILLPAQN
ncbi:MAG: LysM peptidoglycan-binding domain-containing protein [Planctomycetota bacterium]